MRSNCVNYFSVRCLSFDSILRLVSHSEIINMCVTIFAKTSLYAWRYYTVQTVSLILMGKRVDDL